MTKAPLRELLAGLPSVTDLLDAPAIREALDGGAPRALLVEALRSAVETARRALIESSGAVPPDPGAIVRAALASVQAAGRHSLTPVVNGTGVIIHTNLGRSLLSAEAAERVALLSRSYNTLEYDLARGARGSRHVHAEAILRELTGAEAALVVNNNAAAVFLVLNTLAKGREVIVSRGELVEIGGSFRIPDVMAASGANLREVGCTNRTHPEDYAGAVNDATALLMKVHASNYRITGFTREVAVREMTEIARPRGIPVVEDLGSGSLVDLSRYGLKHEPTVQEALRAGADLVTFSGDKLLGGPQAGVIVGRKDLVALCRKNPVTRAFRVGKLTLSALEATLHLYRDERAALLRIPTLAMITAPVPVLQERAARLSALLREADPQGIFDISVGKGFSQVGGGALPEENIPTRLVVMQSGALGATEIERRMRGFEPPVIGRIGEDRYLLDLRTILDDEFPVIRGAFAAVVAGVSEASA